MEWYYNNISDTFSNDNVDITVEWQFWIYGLIIPCVTFPGLFGSLLSFLVLSRKRQHSSLNTFLAGLSLFDFSLLFTALSIYPPMVYCLSGHEFWCFWFEHTVILLYPLSLMSQFCSVWTCVLITIDRYLAVKYPLRSKLWITSDRALLSLSLVTITAIFFRIPTLFELEHDPSGRIRATRLRETKDYINIYHFWLSAPIIFLIPWSILIFLNSVVSFEVHRVFRKRQDMTATGNRHQRLQVNDERDNRSTVMAILVICSFLLFNAPSLINFILENIYGQKEMTKAEHKMKRMLIFITNVLICLNSTINFFIYCVFGHRFLITCRQILFPYCTAHHVPSSPFRSRANTCEQLELRCPRTTSLSNRNFRKSSDMSFHCDL